MTSERSAKQFCKDDISLIENYDKAVADKTQIWHCHHRLECVCGWDTSPDELKSQGMYYNRPASELIFLTQAEHNRTHKVGRARTEETRNKIRETLLGSRFSAERRHNLSLAQRKARLDPEVRKHYSHPHTEETKRKIAEANKNRIGKVYYNNGEINVLCRPGECPEGFIRGRLTR